MLTIITQQEYPEYKDKDILHLAQDQDQDVTTPPPQQCVRQDGPMSDTDNVTCLLMKYIFIHFDSSLKNLESINLVPNCSFAP